MIYLYLYLFLINAAGLVLMLADKHKAKKNLWRIPERTLLLVAALGGSLGVLLGMRLFRHKTLHLRFSLGVPALLVLQLTLALWLYAKKGTPR